MLAFYFLFQFLSFYCFSICLCILCTRPPCGAVQNTKFALLCRWENENTIQKNGVSICCLLSRGPSGQHFVFNFPFKWQSVFYMENCAILVVYRRHHHPTPTLKLNILFLRWKKHHFKHFSFLFVFLILKFVWTIFKYFIFASFKFIKTRSGQYKPIAMRIGNVNKMITKQK